MLAGEFPSISPKLPACLPGDSCLTRNKIKAGKGRNILSCCEGKQQLFLSAASGEALQKSGRTKPAGERFPSS